MSEKIIILTAFWRRPEISEIYWAGIDRLKKKFNIKVLALISDEENLLLARKNEAIIVECDNFPLGKKMNRGLSEALKYDFDFLMQLGSDDLITDEGVAKLIKYFRTGLQFFGLTKLGLINYETKESGYDDYYPQVFGAGRCLAKDLLKRIGVGKKVQILESLSGPLYQYGKGALVTLPEKMALSFAASGLAKILGDEHLSDVLWPDELNSGLDTASENKINTIGTTPVSVPFDKPQVFDIKSERNIWPYEQFKLKPYPVEEIKAVISEKEYNLIYAVGNT